MLVQLTRPFSCVIDNRSVVSHNRKLSMRPVHLLKYRRWSPLVRTSRLIRSALSIRRSILAYHLSSLIRFQRNHRSSFNRPLPVRMSRSVSRHTASIVLSLVASSVLGYQPCAHSNEWYVSQPTIRCSASFAATGYAPDPKDCSKYYTCDSFIGPDGMSSGILMQCLAGLWWDQQRRACVLPSEVACNPYNIINSQGQGQFVDTNPPGKISFDGVWSASPCPLQSSINQYLFNHPLSTHRLKQHPSLSFLSNKHPFKLVQVTLRSAEVMNLCRRSF